MLLTETLIEDARGNELMRGREAMRDAYEDPFRNSPSLHAEIKMRIRVGDYVVDEERLVGARGSPEARRLVVIYHVTGDVIDHVRIIR